MPITSEMLFLYQEAIRILQDAIRKGEPMEEVMRTRWLEIYSQLSDLILYELEKPEHSSETNINQGKRNFRVYDEENERALKQARPSAKPAVRPYTRLHPEGRTLTRGQEAKLRTPPERFTYESFNNNA